MIKKNIRTNLNTINTESMSFNFAVLIMTIKHCVQDMTHFKIAVILYFISKVYIKRQTLNLQSVKKEGEIEIIKWRKKMLFLWMLLNMFNKLILLWGDLTTVHVRLGHDVSNRTILLQHYHIKYDFFMQSVIVFYACFETVQSMEISIYILKKKPTNYIIKMLI